MQALILSAIFGFGKSLLVKFLSKEALKVLLSHTIDIAVKSSKTETDDKVWQDIKPILDSL